MDQRLSDPGSVEHLWAALRDDLTRQGADSQTAEDIVQDTWVLALRNPPQERGRFQSWLHVVAIRLWRRASAREGDRWRRELVAARQERSEAELERLGDQEDSLLRRWVDELPEHYRTVLELRFFEGLEIDEIAERLSLKPATVHTRLRRGLIRLRTRIGPEPEERRRPWIAGLWPAWLHERVARLAGAPLPLLGGAGLVLAIALSAWLLSKGHLRPAPVLAQPVADTASGIEGQERVAFEAAPSATSEPRESAPSTAREPGSRLSGTVRAADGAPVAGARVHVGDTGGSGAERTSVSDERGRYEVDADGELVWATHADQYESPRTYVASFRERSQADLVLGRTRGSAEVEVVTAAGLPVAGARVLVDASRESHQRTSLQGTLEFRVPPAPVTTDARGRCTMPFFEQRETELVVLAEGQPGWSGSVPTPPAGGTLRIELPVASALAGTCRDEAGQPLWNARVEVVQHAGLVQRETLTDPEGTFRIEGLASGEFLLRASEAGPGRISARFVDALEPREEKSIELVLSERASILGRVLAAGEAVAGARVELEAGSPQPTEGEVRAALTDEHGRFAFAGCQSTHELRVFLPGASEPCMEVRKLRPGRGEASYSVSAPDGEPGPIELEFSGPDAPALVELRRDSPARSTILAPSAPGSGLFRSPPLPGGTYRVLAWHPELGTWEVSTLEHDPAAPRVHALAWPEPAVLVVELELPEDVHGEDLEAAVLTPSFHRHGLGAVGTDNALRMLSWSDDEHAFVGTLAPGTYSLLVRGAGLAEYRQVTLAPGELHTLALRPWRGIEATVFFELLLDPPDPLLGRSRSLLPAESVQLEVVTPTGSTTLELPSANQQRVEGGCEFQLWLPCAATELRARTRGGPNVAPRQGRCVLEPGLLDRAEGQPRIRIALTNAPP